MGFAKPLPVLALWLAVSVAGADPSASGRVDDPRDVLFHAIDQARWLSFEGIVARRTSMRDRSIIQVKIAQRAGTSKSTVLSPLPLQGVTSVDDGKTWSTYYPDENRVVSQDSPRKTSWNWRRKKVAAANYTFTAEGLDSVAGRKAFGIVATPKASEMPVRRYWIDAEYPLMLRMEVVTAGKNITMLDTKAIEFRTVADDALKLSTAASVRRIFDERPERFRSADEALELAGVRPALPKLLPFGFVISEPQVIGERGERFVAIRLSDGLASATVYQWNVDDKDPIPCHDKQFVREANGLKMRLVGDIPEIVLSRLLETFVREALKGLQPLLGTSFDFLTLLSLEHDSDEDEADTYLIIRVGP